MSERKILLRKDEKYVCPCPPPPPPRSSSKEEGQKLRNSQPIASSNFFSILCKWSEVLKALLRPNKAFWYLPFFTRDLVGMSCATTVIYILIHYCHLLYYQILYCVKFFILQRLAFLSPEYSSLYDNCDSSWLHFNFKRFPVGVLCISCTRPFSCFIKFLMNLNIGIAGSQYSYPVSVL